MSLDEKELVPGKLPSRENKLHLCTDERGANIIDYNSESTAHAGCSTASDYIFL